MQQIYFYLTFIIWNKSDIGLESGIPGAEYMHIKLMDGNYKAFDDCYNLVVDICEVWLAISINMAQEMLVHLI